MALQHDAQGFLVGNPVDLHKLSADWAIIRKDVRDIRDAVLGRKEPVIQLQAKPVQPAQRNVQHKLNAGRHESATISIPKQTEKGDKADVTVRLKNEEKPVSKTANQVQRDNKGRFTGNGKSGSTSNGRSSDYGGVYDDGESFVRSISGRIAESVKEGVAGVEEADPAVKAVNEVAKPLMRGYDLLLGGSPQKRQESWLRKIFRSLTGFRKEEGAFNKIAAKRLKSIDEKPDEKEGGGGLFGTLGKLFSNIPFIGRLFSFGAAGGAGMRLGSLLKMGNLGRAGRLFKRIPLLGSLLNAAGTALDLYQSENSDTLSRAQKDRRAGKSLGSFAGNVGGMLVGAKLGSMVGTFAGPIGTAIGGFLGGAVGMFLGDTAGEIIGGKVGELVSYIRDSGIPDRIMAAWNEVKIVALGTFDWIESGWSTVVSGVKQAWKDTTVTFKEVGESLSEAWNGVIEPIRNGLNAVASVITGAYEFLKTLPVIGSAIRAAEAAAKKAAEAASELKGKAVEKVKEGTGKAWEATKTVAAKVVPQGLKDSISRRRNRQALENQMVAAGITDPNEQAMFMAQMEHESGGFAKMEEGFNYRSTDRIMAVSGHARKQGKAAVETAMAQGPEAVAELMYGGRMGNTEKGDAYKFRGRGHIQLTGKDNYSAAGKALGIDLLNNPELAADPEIAAKIATWYWKKNPKLVVAGKAGNVVAATQAINGGQNGIEHRKKLFAKYHAGGVPTTTVAKVTVPTEQPAPTLALAAASPMVTPSYVGSGKQAIVAAASTPSVPIMPSPPQLSDAPSVTVPMASNDSNKTIQVSMPPQEVGQDLRERSIAHIATGGLSA
ncbi:MAG: hypothetical protein NC211_03525 [Alistipes senegalensis]|nr:hypothetical protein [Oxalobacter formigenes]MCM1280888.1 hypothetical protein [Alistipes senegalensis]